MRLQNIALTGHREATDTLSLLNGGDGLTINAIDAPQLNWAAFLQSATRLSVAARPLCFLFQSIYQTPRAADVTQWVKPLEQKDMIQWGEICAFKSHYAPLKVLQNCYRAISLTGSRAETAIKYDCIIWQACSKGCRWFLCSEQGNVASR